MRIGRWHVARLSLFVVAAGCSGGNGGDKCQNVTCDDPPADTCKDEQTLLRHAQTGTCDPVSGECSYQVREIGCPRRCLAGRCNQPPPGQLELWIPEGTRLCSRYGWGGDSVVFNWEGKARVTLQAGTIVFGPDDTEIPADPVLQLEAWPGVTATPLAPSPFRRTIQQEGGIEFRRYDFSQSFAVLQRTMEVTLSLGYEYADGEPLEPVIALDDATLFGGENYQGAYLEEWKHVPLISCHFEALEERTRSILVDNGDRLTFTMRGADEEFTWPEPAMVFNFELVAGRFERGTEIRTVTDYFDLSSSVNHHGCCPGYLLHFDQPVGAIQCIWIDEFSYGRNVNYADADCTSFESAPYQNAP